MSEIRLTPEQRAAVENRGGELLVSAAAGSGKTKVLVERLFRRMEDPNYPCDIDEFLIITYTRAAAAELRGKIAEELNRRLAADPGNRRLQRQRLLVYRAQISTVHAFCSSLLREFAHLADWSPDFRLADEAEAEVLRRRTLDRVLNRRYETMSEGDGFSRLVDTLSAGRDDRRLCDIVLDLYLKIQSHPEPERWLEDRLTEFAPGGASDAGDTPWGRLILDRAGRQAGYWAAQMRCARAEMEGYPALEKGYGSCFEDLAVQLERLEAACAGTWDEAADRAALDFGRLGGVRNFEDKALQERLKAVRDRCKKRMERYTRMLFRNSAGNLADMAAVYPAVEALFQLTRDFDEVYAREKQRRGLADFSDLEHMAARLLTDSETGEPTALATEVSARYREVMVDEYQDTNRVQNLIFSAVSGRGARLFMVGDVKQSIYRFRLADPAIFLQKYRDFPGAEEAEEGEPRKIVLSRNFRSRDTVLQAVNFVFRSIMSREFGEMDYTPAEYLYPGAAYPETQADRVELDVLDMSAVERGAEEESPKKSEAEARFVAARIRELLDRKMLVSDPDTGELRPITPGDIAILMRSPASKTALYSAALAEVGISFRTEGTGESFFDAPEIAAVLSFLAVVDNPIQDVPLIAVLRSPIFSFSADRLAEIRRAAPEENFFAALQTAEGEDCGQFLAGLRELRLLAGDMSTDRLIWHIYSRYSVLAVFGAMPEGARRQRNLLALFDLARKFEADGYQGLFRFTAYLRRLRENGEEPVSLPGSEKGDAVRLMSIHKSKGLEFPVVFLADTAKKFNREDIKRPVLIHSELGAGPKRLDPELRVEYPTLARRAVELKLEEEMLAEELRVLYVAMTRAREKLIITAALQNAPGTLKRLLPGAGSPVDPQVLAEAGSMAEWLLLPALARPEAAVLREAAGEPGPGLSREDDGPAWDIRPVDCAPYLKPAVPRPEASRPPEKTEDAARWAEELKKALSWRYPYQEETLLPSKLTATQLKGRFGDREAEEGAPRTRHQAFDRPRFVTKRRGLSAAERGTALHLAMQHIDFAHTGSKDEIQAELDRLTARRLLTAEQAGAVSPATVFRFFESELGRRVKSAPGLLREFKFSVLAPAKRFYSQAEDGEILLQGVVDCCIVEQAGLTVVDFKTDRVPPGEEAERAEEYRDQLNAYGEALEQVTGKPVLARLLYFFATGTTVEL